MARPRCPDGHLPTLGTSDSDLLPVEVGALALPVLAAVVNDAGRRVRPLAHKGVYTARCPREALSHSECLRIMGEGARRRIEM
jgi:hypothetical protein